MAERLEPDAASRRHQAIRHFVAEARRSDAAVRERVRAEVLPAMLARAPVERWVVDDTPIHESGPHSVGVAVQYSGPVRATANRQVLVGLSVATAEASLPVASELHRPEAWAEDRPRRRKACVPPAPPFRTKNEIALAQVRRAVEAGLPRGILLADGGYGDDRGLRAGARALGLDHCVVVRPSALAAPADAPAPGAPRRGAACRAHAGAAPLSTLARGFRAADGREVGAGRRFAARRVRTTPCLDRGRVGPEEWLPVEDAERPADRAYWLCSLPAGTPVEGLARHARARARVERDLRELKQEVGLDAFEGRGWRGFDHHVTPCLAAHGFLVRERGLLPPGRPAAARPNRAA
jgi:SRSO17 transposase